MTAFIEFTSPADASRPLKWIYFTCVMISLGANMFCVVVTAALSVLGTGLALRGPDGSMITAVEGMYSERSRVFLSFGVGVVFLQLAALFGVRPLPLLPLPLLACSGRRDILDLLILWWIRFDLAWSVSHLHIQAWILMDKEAAMACTVLLLYLGYSTAASVKRMQKRLDFDEEEAVDFSDVFNAVQNMMMYTPHRIMSTVQSTFDGRGAADEEAGLLRSADGE